MTPSPSVMLFSAGFGKRMAPLTDNLPKPLIEVGGRPLVDHALELVRSAGIKKIVSNTHYRADLIGPYLVQRGVQCLFEPEILETGGGLRNALRLLGTDPVITLNSDSVWGGVNPVRQLLAEWRPETMDALLLVVPLAKTLGHKGKGDFDVTSQGRLTRGGPFIYSGLQIMKTELLHNVPEAKFSLNRVWDLMAAKERLFGSVYSGLWCDVGQPESIIIAEAMLEQAGV